tara:strand:- start:1293 stop:1508 length:216 start_codon:yes stop_codon:yes gene_type:complete
MDMITFEEIVSVLARNGRPDLIQEFKEFVKVDEDYKPPPRNTNDSLSDTEGSATDESLEFIVDEDGFHSLG